MTESAEDVKARVRKEVARLRGTYSVATPTSVARIFLAIEACLEEYEQPQKLYERVARVIHSKRCSCPGYGENDEELARAIVADLEQAAHS